MSEEVKTASITEWKKAAVHAVTLPSGVVVKIKIPDLAALIEAGTLPQNLIDAALNVVGDGAQKVTLDMVKEEREFTNEIVKVAVVEPTVNDANVNEIPVEDKAMIMQIATRQTDLDAEGKHIGGLHKSEDFRKFRGLDSFDPFMADL